MRSKKGQERTVSNLCHDEADCTMRNGHDELRPSPSRENAPLQLGHHSVSPLQHHFDPLKQSHHYQHTPKDGNKDCPMQLAKHKYDEYDRYRKSLHIQWVNSSCRCTAGNRSGHHKTVECEHFFVLSVVFGENISRS